jgi:hypothetical protein
VLGNVSELKPADVKSRIAALLKGFDTTANKAVASVFGTWKQDLAAAHAALDTAVAGKGDAHGTSITGTAALVAARGSFLHVYNKVAKKLMAGLLADLGRESEYELFFKDLTVNEDGSPAKKLATGDAEASTGGTTKEPADATAKTGP